MNGPDMRASLPRRFGRTRDAATRRQEFGQDCRTDAPALWRLSGNGPADESPIPEDEVVSVKGEGVIHVLTRDLDGVSGRSRASVPR